MTAIVIVDIQNDFLPGGALAVNEGDAVIPVINALLDTPFDAYIATKDWHPHNHGSFASNHEGKKPGDHIQLEGLDQILWPAHCIQEKRGSEFSDKLNTKKFDKIIYKGTDPKIDSYSTFFDNGHRKATGLGEYLKDNKIKDLYIAGLATDYCVKFSVLDALKLGFNVYVVADGCRAVNLNPSDEKKALKEMELAGAKII